MKIDIDELEYLALVRMYQHVLHDKNIECEDCETCPLHIMEPVDNAKLGNELKIYCASGLMREVIDRIEEKVK